MKRHTQQAGIRDWYGPDLLDLQAEPLKVLDQFFGQFGGYVLSGCTVTPNGGKYDVSPGLVVLAGTDPEGKAVRLVVPYEGATAQNLPLYLTLKIETIEDTYRDGLNKPVAYNYKAVASNVKPTSQYVEIKVADTLRFSDVLQDAKHQFLTDSERTAWNGKETSSGAQAKANAALASAKSYTDAREELIRIALGSGDAATLSDAEAYADGLISGLVDSAPAGLDTLKKLASAIGNNATFSSWVTTQLSGKQTKIKNVNIANFNSFDPSTLGLAVGECCNFNHYSTSSTTGRPSMGTGTNQATNNPLSGIYGWSGTVTRIYSTYYMVTAYGQNTTTGRPQMATRIYYNTTYYDWVLSTEYASKSSSGYIKLPSGIMIEWARVRANNVTSSSFPLAFSSTPYSVVAVSESTYDAGTVRCACVLEDYLTSSQFRIAVKANNDWDNTEYARYIAVGPWK